MMGASKQQYDERRALERENQLLREREENRRLKEREREAEVFDLVLGGLVAFFTGNAAIVTYPETRPGAMSIKFDWPDRPTHPAAEDDADA